MTSPRSETVPRWALLAVLIALGANSLASTMTGVTIDLMRSHSAFAQAVRAHDLRLLQYYQGIGYLLATIAVLTFAYGLGATLLTHFLAERMRANPVVGRVLEKLAGVFLIGFGVKLALSK